MHKWFALLAVAACGGSGGVLGGGAVGHGAVSPAPFAIRSTLGLVETRSGYSDVAIIYSDLPIDCAHVRDEITLPAPADVTTFTLTPSGRSFQVGTFQRTGWSPSPIATQTRLTKYTGESVPIASSTGTVTVTAVGDTVTGSFEAQMVHPSDGSDAGTYTGTFEAPICNITLN